MTDLKVATDCNRQQLHFADIHDTYHSLVFLSDDIFSLKSYASIAYYDCLSTKLGRRREGKDRTEKTLNLIQSFAWRICQILISGWRGGTHVLKQTALLLCAFWGISTVWRQTKQLYFIW